MTKRINIRVHAGEDIEVYAALSDEWAPMVGTLIEARDQEEGLTGHFALVCAKDSNDENLIQMAVISTMSGTKIGEAVSLSYEDAMQEKNIYIGEMIKEHLEEVGGLAKANALHALRLAEMVLEIGPQQDKPIKQAKLKRKKKGRADEQK